ncbi:hypothetical protein JXA32_00370 [Candidatus Sumerlaeota bacterium]|nr:hypothetical protein [Candidatus Sumerlaeota bacterium]
MPAPLNSAILSIIRAKFQHNARRRHGRHAFARFGGASAVQGVKGA